MDYEAAKKVIAESNLAKRVNPAWDNFVERLARVADAEGLVVPVDTMLDVAYAIEDYYSERDLSAPARVAASFNLKPLLKSILSAPVIDGLTENGIIPPESTDK